MVSEMNRRTFVKSSLAAGLTLAAGNSAASTEQAVRQDPYKPLTSPDPLPQGHIGKLRIGRLLLGSNMITGIHDHGLSYVNALAQHYQTDKKILQTLEMAEENGIDAISVTYLPRPMKLLKQHRRRGGKMKWVMNLMVSPDPDLHAFGEEVMKAAYDGVEAIFVHGGHADALVVSGKTGLIGEAIDRIKMADLPAGVAAHNLDVVQECEKIGVPTEYYVKTFHHHNFPGAPTADQIKGATCEIPGYWDRDPQRTIEVMKTVKKPWIAYKVMAAGAIPPEEAFDYAFNHGADFVLAGMFDFEIAHDVRLARKVIEAHKSRERLWAS